MKSMLRILFYPEAEMLLMLLLFFVSERSYSFLVPAASRRVDYLPPGEVTGVCVCVVTLPHLRGFNVQHYTSDVQFTTSKATRTPICVICL